MAGPPVRWIALTAAVVGVASCADDTTAMSSSEDAAADPDASTDAGDVATLPPDGLALVVGRLDGGGAFEPLTDGAAVEIVQGPQGGIHAEVVVQATVGPALASGPKIFPVLLASLHIDGELVGLFDGGKVALLQQPQTSDYRSSVVPVYFADNEASTYAGQVASLHVELTLGDAARSVELSVSLVDQL